VLSGVVHHAVEHGDRGRLVISARQAWGAMSAEPFPFGRDALRSAYHKLDELGRRWVALGVGEQLTVNWPSR
jgi:hypothetical protein